MAHYAIVKNGTVIDVHCLANGVVDDLPFPESEPLGQTFLADLWGGDPAEYVECSYNANFRGVYPGVGYAWDGTDFIAPAEPEPEPESPPIEEGPPSE